MKHIKPTDFIYYPLLMMLVPAICDVCKFGIFITGILCFIMGMLCMWDILFLREWAKNKIKERETE